MGWIPVGTTALLAYHFHDTAAPLLMWLSIGTGAVCAWSYGLMHNHAVRAASRRADYRGHFNDFRIAEVDSVPDSLAWINMASAAATVALIVVAIVRYL